MGIKISFEDVVHNSQMLSQLEADVIQNMSGRVTYVMNRRILELVLFLVVEDEAVLFDVADDRRLPSRALQERNKTVENPILETQRLGAL